VRRLPVLIETALAEGETVAGRVGSWLESQLVGDSGGLDPALVEALLRFKRLIPILDHVSELPEEARQRLLRHLPPGLVIATSRSLDDGYRERPLSRIEPLQIATDRLQSFFLDYLRQQGQGELLKDDDLVPAQNQLRRIVGDKPITALLAQMFIDDVIAKRRQGLLAGSVPELMLGYVARVDTPSDPGMWQRAGMVIDGVMVQKAFKVLALASHRQGAEDRSLFQPVEFPLSLAERALAAADGKGLKAEKQRQALLGYLIDLNLLRNPGADLSWLRFPLDPLADYLAALRQLEHLEADSTGDGTVWQGFLAELEQRSDQERERMRGFLLALRDCCTEQSKSRALAMPAEAPDRLGRRGFLDPEEERYRLALQRARKGMWELGVPVASERRDAIAKLAAMAAADVEPGEQQAVRTVASERLALAIRDGELPIEERSEAAVVLGLIGEGVAVAALEQVLGEEERYRLALQRARKWMWELGVPVASERRDAIAKLAAMAAAGAQPGEQRAVRTVASERLALALQDGELPIEERSEAATVLGLIGDGVAIAALEQVMEAEEQPVLLRRAAAEALGLSAAGAETQLEHRQRITAALERQLRCQPLEVLVQEASDWERIDVVLPLLQGAARGLQLAASRDLPLLCSGPGQVVPMLTLTALNQAEGGALEVRTEVLEKVQVWRLPLPQGQQLEMVLVPGGEYLIGSPEGEAGKLECYSWTPESKELDKEPLRPVRLAPLAMVRFPITQAQWAAVAELEPGLKTAPGSYEAKGLWEAHGQPGCLPVDSVSWNDCQQWLARLNRWLAEQWREQGLAGEAPELRLPGEGEWEAACRAESETPLHFGDMLDPSWANYDHTYGYGAGRKKDTFPQRPLAIGCFGLVNRWGLAEMHGQMYEWCGDLWHPSPLGGPQDGSPWEHPDPSLEAAPRADNRLLRGGSWFGDPHYCRAAYRNSYRPGLVIPLIGVRPCCLLPPGSLLDPSGP
jgi:formylglycine-generating enzyme required for sulfatase activity